MATKMNTEYEGKDRSPLAPPPGVMIALGSIAVHCEELFSPSGHDFDKQAILGLLSDPRIKLWLKDMDALGLMPKKR